MHAMQAFVRSVAASVGPLASSAPIDRCSALAGEQSKGKEHGQGNVHDSHRSQLDLPKNAFRLPIAEAIASRALLGLCWKPGLDEQRVHWVGVLAVVGR